MSLAHPHHPHWLDLDRGHLRDSVLRLGAGVGFVAVALAAGAFAVLNWPHARAPQAEPAAAMMIELAPIAVSAASQADAVPAPPSEKSPEATPDAPDTPQQETPPPEPVVEQVAEKLPQVEAAPTPAEVVLPNVEPKKEAVKEPPPPKRVERPKAEAKPTRKRESPVTAAAPRAEAATAETTAAPSQGSAASQSAAIADWRSRAFAHLSRYKRPQAGHVGKPGVSISLGAGGAVTSASLARSSGDPVLDQEAVAMARRASPFPPHPNGAHAFTVAIEFTR